MQTKHSDSDRPLRNGGILLLHTHAHMNAHSLKEHGGDVSLATSSPRLCTSLMLTSVETDSEIFALSCSAQGFQDTMDKEPNKPIVKVMLHQYVRVSEKGRKERAGSIAWDISMRHCTPWHAQCLGLCVWKYDTCLPQRQVLQAWACKLVRHSWVQWRNVRKTWAGQGITWLLASVIPCWAHPCFCTLRRYKGGEQCLRHPEHIEAARCQRTRQFCRFLNVYYWTLICHSAVLFTETHTGASSCPPALHVWLQLTYYSRFQ